ncbi:MAG: ABC transporter substrate-binding protein [Armatimonadota bacterium]|nr:ABC transporter substrate-binding protein [Armatimonadota bacterium]
MRPLSRRQLLKAGGAAAALALTGRRFDRWVTPAFAQGLASLGIQLGWFANIQAAGDFVAIEKGFYRDAGLDVRLQPGGPGIDPIQNVASGSIVFGNAASNGVLVNARANGLPLKAFATALQRHPFAFFYMADANIRTPKDFEGKTIGIQPTARPLLEAVLRKHHLRNDQVKTVFVGGDITPLVARRVDVITGWVIDRLAQFENMGVSGSVRYFRLWDLGIRMYAYVYFTTDPVLRERRDVVARFVGACAKGWMYAREHPEETADIVIRRTSGLDRALELKTWQNQIGYLTSIMTKQRGWGYMDPKVWTDLIETYKTLDQIPRLVSADEVMTNEFVEMARTPKV